MGRLFRFDFFQFWTASEDHLVGFGQPIEQMIVRKLEYLIALARGGHFARAAAACHVSQPTLSAAIRQLEIEMGVPIVERGSRIHGLTEEGEKVLAFAKLMATECEHLRETLSEQGRETFGTLRIGVIPSAILLVPNLTVPFHKQHTRVNLKIIDLNPPDVMRAFQGYSIDVAISYVSDSDRSLWIYGRAKRASVCVCLLNAIATASDKQDFP
jgi:DNA-binding transcriptional LysR family regulator